MNPTQRLRALCAGGALLSGSLAAGCGGGPEPLLVFAAASLADALEEAGAAWEEVHPEASVAFNFNSSNDLARQIAAGAPAALFVSADRERLVAAGRADLAAAVALLGNELVVVAPAGSGTSVAGARGLLAFDRLGLADPEAVPAGVYAREWLAAEGVWDELRDRVVPALDVRANLAAVASGSVPAGVVYATDAGTSDRVEVVYRVPGERAPAVVCWAAPILDSYHRLKRPTSASAEPFLAFLAGPEAGEIFRRHGFRHLPSEDAGGGSSPGD
ncbi:MAG TPA: molybdate ABC transporter substrate-binding protein [Thermoanaerobaculia bacterium]|nr:molybdate ABC transporter substrate-binding protein [Thermoanaerobaculia bacterium]